MQSAEIWHRVIAVVQCRTGTGSYLTLAIIIVVVLIIALVGVVVTLSTTRLVYEEDDACAQAVRTPGQASGRRPNQALLTGQRHA